ncbi:MAG TPA: DUF4197 domain-containing protein [Gammaproteobacteria bacterium]|nr:DUF4197 domain-containing protein [Gammaproteobacteria bacterium]
MNEDNIVNYARFSVLLILMNLVLVSVSVQAGWRDYLDDYLGEEKTSESAATTADVPASSAASTAPSSADMSKAILDALSVGVQKAIKLLGKQGGYLNDAQVKIALPEQLQYAESLLRKVGQGKYADRFIKRMNQAAEQSVTKTTEIFLDTIKKMSVKDARSIVTGPDDAATRYFKDKTSDQLRSVIKPVVSQTMDESGVGSAYKKFITKSKYVSQYLNEDTVDLDSYVTNKTLDGLFLKLAEEEKLIRKDPVARSTDLLKQVFGYYAK